MSSPRPSAALAVLTADARGAIAVVRVWGPNALAVTNEVFRPFRGEGLASTPSGKPRYGRIGGDLGDEVVVLHTDDSPTEIEIHYHGGPAAVELVVRTLADAGAERLAGADWVASRPGSRIRNEAIIDLARVSTVRTAEILLDQTSGALENELKELRAMIANGHPGALECVKALLGRAEVGLRLLGGWKIALLGLPNVGKSRLMNALVGFDRSIVSPTAGTTRDVVTIKTAVDGYPVEIADLAGLRETSHPIEREGVARARSQAFQSDLVIVVLDRSTPLNDEARGLLDPNGSQLVVANKVDLEPCWEPWNEGIISISAERGDGIARLLTAIGERLVSEPILPGAGVPFREAHRSALIEVLGALSDKDHNRAIGALQTLLS